MDTEPMFCFETSLKMLYFSMLVYRYEESDGRGVTLEGAMALYNLENFELMWERKLDTKALMAWNEDTVVLSFRGTASFRNVLADIKVRRGRHACVAHQACMSRDSRDLQEEILLLVITMYLINNSC
jgi:hypothetical protein